MTTYPDTLWNNRREAATTALQALVPFEGAIEGKNNKALEAYRCFARAYYEIYNNGGFNWKHVTSGFTKACKSVGAEKPLLTDMRAQVRGRGICEDLEAIGDKIIDAALAEQLNNRVAAEREAAIELANQEAGDRMAARL